MQARSFGTHDGSFHADDVTACSLLLLFDRIDRERICRTRDLSRLQECDYVCDVGGIYDSKIRRFDHHQAEYQGPFSSAGMVLLYLKEQGIISAALYDMFHKTLIQGVDAHDNGRAVLEPGTTSFSQVISNFLPIEYEVSAEEMLDAFFQAVDFVVGHLSRLKERFAYTARCKGIVKQAMVASQNVLFFDHPLPWMDNFFELGGEWHPAEFVVMPSGKHWKLRGIPPNSQERMQVRRPLPEAWAGLHEESLRAICGISGAIFCHKGRFISIWETKEDALHALHLAMQQSK